MDYQEQHKRRVRYQGTHPRSFKEKYKELQPEKYPETVDKVIQKGSTPAGMHISICVSEILEFLQIKPGQTGVDATLGYGGHTSQMLKCLESKGHIYALDVDAVELPKTRKRLADLGYGPDILTVKQLNFADIDQIAAEAGQFDFVLWVVTQLSAQSVRNINHPLCGCAVFVIQKNHLSVIIRLFKPIYNERKGDFNGQ